ncbi:hypothetical protein AVEN_164615-1 [Araneus ventricosus]|uniref:Uncharacterized protein n=1 Tax=Araneus ventricosus TaxID=182803 RepID=A0A4Y2X8H8_ARAVE|nr:hypothetical protein AVEN_164615-1 [Araneus ventricosus]
MLTYDRPIPVLKLKPSGCTVPAPKRNEVVIKSDILQLFTNCRVMLTYDRPILKAKLNHQAATVPAPKRNEAKLNHQAATVPAPKRNEVVNILIFWKFFTNWRVTLTSLTGEGSGV